MSASAIFILDLKGKPLISRNYKGDVSMSEIDYFMPLLMQKEEECALTPLLSHGKIHFLWIKHSNLYCILSASDLINHVLEERYHTSYVEQYNNGTNDLGRLWAFLHLEAVQVATGQPSERDGLTLSPALSRGLDLMPSSNSNI
ncbi:AP-1 complex subunit mu-2 [Varanus komodoensis]|nr:AP-1 complex subunit mu-2 [Varanus komodoensis]